MFPHKLRDVHNSFSYFHYSRMLQMFNIYDTYDIQGKCVDIVILGDMNELFIRTNRPGLLLEWGLEILIVEN